METYITEIVETLTHVEIVEANSERDAILKVKDMYNNEEIILCDTVECNVDTVFNVLDDNYDIIYSED